MVIRHNFTGLAAFSLLLLLVATAHAQTSGVGDDHSTIGSVALDPAAPVNDIMTALQLVKLSGRVYSSEILAEFSRHSDALVRLEVTRIFAIHPELDVAERLSALADDPVPQVAVTALVALARSPWPDAVDELADHLDAPSAPIREYAAIGLFVRHTLAEFERHEPADDAPIDPSLLDRARTQIVSPEGESWLNAIEHYRELIQIRSRWLDTQQRLLALEQNPNLRDCVLRARANPALLLPVTAEGQPMPAVELFGWPDTAVVDGASDIPEALLISGRHDELAERRFGEADRVDGVVRFAAAVETLCARDGPLHQPFSGQTPSPMTPALPDRHPDFFGWVGVDMGLTNDPVAYRAGAGDFLIGDGIEITLLPELLLAFSNASDQIFPGRPERELPIVDGYGLELRLGGVFSTAFFKDRSRPFGAFAALVDNPLGDRGLRDQQAANLRYRFETRLFSGMEEDLRDVTVYPTPHLTVVFGVDYLRSSDGVPSVEQDTEVTGQVSYVEYLFDDPTNPPRDRRWLEPSIGGRKLFDVRWGRFRPGFLGDLAFRANWDGQDVMAGIGNLAPAVRWQMGEVTADMWIGAGGTWLFDQWNGPKVELIGGFSARYVNLLGNYLLSCSVGIDRWVSLLGRNGFVGVIDRVEASIGLSLQGAMRESARVSLFAMQTTPLDTNERVGWGGIEVFIPVGLMSLNQEISYLMRYSTLIDQARFGDRSQAVFESYLTAGVKF